MFNTKNSITNLSGIGGAKAVLFTKLGISTIDDLINYFPFRYEDTSQIVNICDLVKSEDKKTIQGEIISIKNFRTKNGKKLTSGLIADGTGEIEVLWFNQHFLAKILRPGQKYLFNGKVEGDKKLKLISPTYEKISEYLETIHLGRITPIYPETKGLTSKMIRKLIKDFFTFIKFHEVIEENISKEIIEKENLISKEKAVQYLHLPENFEQVELAKERMAFEEIYEILKKVQKEKKKSSKFSAPVIKKDDNLVNKFVNNLPFKPTKDQLTAIDEVLNDCGKETPMNRLLEGDVGSGKTLVAIIATINAISKGFQTAILAPTQVLAEQHFRTFLKFAPWLENDILLVTGNTVKDLDLKNKKQILIGTHAILHQADNLLENLGLVIIDEQHRFGVKQREFLTEFIKEWGENKKVPHVLSMTATPIPRSLTLTLYGEMNVSIIESMPEGRIPVETHVVPEEKRNDSYNWIRKQVENGGQIFVICPLVEESEVLDVKSATKEFERLSKEVFPDLKLELLHGRIKGDEKERILNDFKNKKFDILVSTAVVEVGIDIPDATVIIIEGAERFGLAQLHQFRGRVGRSNKKSYCLLYTTSESEDAIERLKYFASTNKGLEIAEYDLKKRGPGEVYGLKQSGIPNLKFANLLDLQLIKRVKKWFE